MQPQGQPFNPLPSKPAPLQTNPDSFKAMIVGKYPDGIASDGKRYADIPARTLTAKIVQKFPQGVTNDGRKYKDFLTPTYIGQDLVKGTTDEISGAFQGGVNKFKEGLGEASSGKFPIEPALKMGAGAIEAGISPLAPIFSPIGKGVNAIVDKISDIPQVQKFAQSKAGQTTSRIAEDVTNASTIAGGVAGLKAPTSLDVARSPIANTFKAGVDKLPPLGGGSYGARIATPSEATVSAKVLKSYDKGVKPLLGSKTTPAKLNAYKDDVITAVKTIKENKDNLSYNDTTGDVIKGQTPRTLQEFSDAVEQTKKSVFSEYDALAKQAGEAGVSIPLKPIATELNTVINNKALQLTNPKAVAYAKDVQARYSKTGKLDATTAQEVIQNYNKSLEAFYRNPSYDTASQAAIDAMIANNMRHALDSGITKLTGTQYQALKSKYGALKSVERDVIKATLRDARKNTKGLIDFTDIFSGGQVVNGILALNPATIAQGLTAKAIAEFYKYLNDPNRAIDKMFKAAENLP